MRAFTLILLIIGVIGTIALTVLLTALFVLLYRGAYADMPLNKQLFIIFSIGCGLLGLYGWSSGTLRTYRRFRALSN